MVGGHHGGHDGQTGQQDQPPGGGHEVAALRDEQAPLRGRRRRAVAEETQDGQLQDGGAELQRGSLVLPLRQAVRSGDTVVLVTAVGRKAFEQAIGMVARGGTVALNGLPPGDFPLDIFGMVLNGVTVRGSIVGTRLDLQESLDFAAQGKVRATVHQGKLEDINDIFAKMHKGQIEGRIVLDMAS